MFLFFRNIVFVASTSVLTGCASMHPVSSSTLEAKQLIGRWTSAGDTMNVYCSGSFSYEKQATDILGLGARKSTGSVIAEINETEFIIGPYFPVKETFKVQSWPHEVNGAMIMIVDGRQWARESYKPCLVEDGH